MTFAPLNRKAPKAPGTDAGRTGVTIVGSGRQRKAVATIRQGDSLVFLGSGTVEHCTALFDEAKAKQQKQLNFENTAKRNLDKQIRHGINYGTGNPYHG